MLAALNLLAGLEGRKIAVSGRYAWSWALMKSRDTKWSVCALLKLPQCSSQSASGKMIAEAAQQSGLPANAVQCMEMLPRPRKL